MWVGKPVKEDLEALLRLARSKRGYHTAPGLPLALIDESQFIIAPEHAPTPAHQSWMLQVCHLTMYS